MKRKGVRSPSVQKDRDHTGGGYGGLMVANPEFLLRFFSLHHLRRPKFFLYHSVSRFSFSFCSVGLFWVFMLCFFFYLFNKRFWVFLILSQNDALVFLIKNCMRESESSNALSEILKNVWKRMSPKTPYDFLRLNFIRVIFLDRLFS